MLSQILAFQKEKISVCGKNFALKATSNARVVSLVSFYSNNV